jgi:hypothetical protein
MKWTNRLLLPLLMLSVLLIFYAELALTNRILARGDVFLYFYPFWTAAAEALRAGRVALWNPDLFMGAPFLANSQVGFLYPLNWPLWLTLSPPSAVTASLLLHLAIAAAGAYQAGRRLLELRPAAAVLAGLLFALGGYLTAQVEHVNQIQGLAWMPWQLAVLGSHRRRPGRRTVALLGGLFALQLLAGHTQTAFIAGVGLGVWAMAGGLVHRLTERDAWRPFVLLGAGAALSLPLAAAQLLPTLELAQLSSRQGGLPFNEVVSFSLHPLLVGRSLLPLVQQTLFTEYTAYLPLTALFLAALWLVDGWRAGRRRYLPLVALLVLGLLLALGQFNPLYWLLGRLPGFDLFRVPARWLVWYALVAALFAGAGWQRLREGARPSRRATLAGFGLIGALIVWTLAAHWLARIVPLPAEAPAELPGGWTWLAWSVELAVLGMVSVFDGRWSRFAPVLGALAAVLVLYVAGRSQPAHNPTAPEAFYDVRPAAARLQARAACLVPDVACPPVQHRFISLSDIFFDTGDKVIIEQIYGGQLGAGPLRDYLVAVKQKEIIAPNLSLAVDLQAVDGFDGGVLPLASYSQLAKLLLPAGEQAVDWRLRERLTAVPAQRWLELFDAGYVITDKVGDAWRDGVYFDRQHPVVVDAGATLSVPVSSDFPATALLIWSETGTGMATVTFADGRALTLRPVAVDESLWRVDWDQARVTRELTLDATETAWQVTALTLVNDQESTFLSLVPGPFQLIHSGDIKLYALREPPERAVLLGGWDWAPDRDAALAAIASPAFDPGASVILTGIPPADLTARPPARGAVGEAEIRTYEPERVVVGVETSEDAMLLLKDAAYPGWEATLDGQPIPLWEANGFFRAVHVPPGRHLVAFHYQSGPFAAGVAISLVTLSLIVLAAVISRGWGRLRLLRAPLQVEARSPGGGRSR